MARYSEGREERQGEESGAGGLSREVLRSDGHLRVLVALFYAVGVFVALVAANTDFYAGSEAGSIDRTAINVVAGVGLCALVAALLLPWSKVRREAFFVVPAVGVLLISVCVYYSGGWDSFAYSLYSFAAVFFALYFRPRLATLGVTLTVVAGLNPMLYQADLEELLGYLFLEAPVFVALALVSGYMLRQVVLRDRALRASEAELLSTQREADIDGLTRVSNRRYLERRLGETLERGPSRGEIMLLFADVDDFKQINDSHGHAVGDEVLRLIASVLSSHARKTDLVARYGGEEFVVLMFGASADNARALFDRVRESVGRSSEERFGFPIRLSVGAASLEDFPELSDTQEPLKIVDGAMYEAKRRGKDRIFIQGTGQTS